MATAATAVQEVADLLHDAARSGRPVPPVRDLLPAGDVTAAYAVQSRNARRAVAQGQRVVGWKIGLTSAAVQRQLGVDQPDFGRLLSEMSYPDGATIPVDAVLQPRIEAEVALVLAADLDLAVPTEADVRAAVREVRAALEIVGSRITGWDITLVDTVADNASAGAFVLGRDPYRLARRDLAAVEMALRRNGEVVSRGSGADCLGNPLAAAAWLAGTMYGFQQPLRRGDIILTGALGPVVPVAPGDTFEAELSGLGRVRAAFTTGEAASSGEAASNGEAFPDRSGFTNGGADANP